MNDLLSDAGKAHWASYEARLERELEEAQKTWAGLIGNVNMEREFDLAEARVQLADAALKNWKRITSKA